MVLVEMDLGKMYQCFGSRRVQVFNLNQTQNHRHGSSAVNEEWLLLIACLPPWPPGSTTSPVKGRRWRL